MFAEKTKEELEKKQSSIEFIEQISGLNYGYVSIHHLSGSLITPQTPINEVKSRFTVLISGAYGFLPGLFRMDQHHGKPLHLHFGGSESPVSEVQTLNDLFLMILGSEWIVLQSQLNL